MSLLSYSECLYIIKTVNLRVCKYISSIWGPYCLRLWGVSSNLGGQETVVSLLLLQRTTYIGGTPWIAGIYFKWNDNTLTLYIFSFFCLRHSKNSWNSVLTDSYFHMQTSSYSYCTTLQGGDMEASEAMVWAIKHLGIWGYIGKISMTN